MDTANQVGMEPMAEEAAAEQTATGTEGMEAHTVAAAVAVRRDIQQP